MGSNREGTGPVFVGRIRAPPGNGVTRSGPSAPKTFALPENGRRLVR
jgi:hypothetical protein